MKILKQIPNQPPAWVKQLETCVCLGGLQGQSDPGSSCQFIFLHSKDESSHKKDKENILHGYISLPVPHRQKKHSIFCYFMLVLWTQMVLKNFCWLRSYPTFSSGNDALLWTWRLQSNPLPSFLIGAKWSQYLVCTAFPQNKIWLGSQVLPFMDNTLRLKDTNNSRRWDESRGQKIWNTQKQQPDKLLRKFLLTSFSVTLHLFANCQETGIADYGNKK